MLQRELTGAQIIVEAIRREGVKYVFGIPGGAAIPICDALVGTDITLVLTRHEQGATHMADGFARASGKPAVVLVTSGPGGTNTITGLLTAHMDSIPMVVVTGQQSGANLGMDSFQEADVAGISLPVVKHSYLVQRTEDLPRVLGEAFYLARTGRPGPVLVDVPRDVAAAKANASFDEEYHLPGYRVPADGDPEQIEKAAHLLEKSRRPVLLVGHGAVISGAEVEVRKLAETLRIPVTNTLLGKGCFPETHQLSLGMLGMHGTAYANKVLTVDCAVVGDARRVIAALLERVKPGDTEEWLVRIARWKKKHHLRYPARGKLTAQLVIDALYKLTGGERDRRNRYMGMVRQWQSMFYENRLSGVELKGSPDFVKLAQSYGCRAFRIRSVGEAKKVLGQALEHGGGPCVIDAMVDKEDNVFPMIPAGASLREMMLHPPEDGDDGDPRTGGPRTGGQA
jgi:acetolactate synthase-1/2/3 large subunit